MRLNLFQHADTLGSVALIWPDHHADDLTEAELRALRRLINAALDAREAVATLRILGHAVAIDGGATVRVQLKGVVA